MSDDTPAPPPGGMPGASALLSDTTPISPPTETSAARGAAMGEIARLKADPVFQQRLLKGDADAINMVTQLTRTVSTPTGVIIGGEPTPAETQQRLDSWTAFADLSPEVTEQIRNGTPVTQAEYKMAQQTKARLMSDKAWCARYLDGDRACRQQMSLVSIILSSQVAPEKAK